MHWQYYLLASCIQLLQHPRAVREGVGWGRAIKSQAQFACSTCYTLAHSLARHISHKLASLGFIYEPMILPAICLNGNVTTLASQMKTRDSLPIGKQQKLWLQLWIMANTVAYTSSVLTSPPPLLTPLQPPLLWHSQRHESCLKSFPSSPRVQSHVCISIWVFCALRTLLAPLNTPSPPLGSCWRLIFSVLAAAAAAAACDKIINQRWIR